MFIGEMKNKLKFNFSQIITKITNSPYSAKSTYKITIEINHCNDIFFKKAKISKNNWKTNLNHIFISKLKQIFSENFCDDFNQLFSIKIFSHHQPIYITGRYKKYSRHISQTPWLVDSSYKPLTSIQEILSPKFCEYLQSNVSFSASGREDIDVQMLGSGRPFILAFNDPKYGTLEQDLLVEIEKSINSSTTLLEVSKLYIANEKALKYLHEVGETKRKSYTFVNFLTSSALIFCDTILEDHTLNVFNSTKDLKINQWTPIRVMHRFIIDYNLGALC
uniref:tRNA pseudouridine(55) synthase n=1 Tax=Henneguya salminicola TaxID=69463 RepID=A0A6G3MEQ8_HENSL